jgi:hypothetical protein
VTAIRNLKSPHFPMFCTKKYALIRGEIACYWSIKLKLYVFLLSQTIWRPVDKRPSSLLGSRLGGAPMGSDFHPGLVPGRLGWYSHVGLLFSFYHFFQADKACCGDH